MGYIGGLEDFSDFIQETVLVDLVMANASFVWSKLRAHAFCLQVSAFLSHHFSEVADYSFTADMENELSLLDACPCMTRRGFELLCNPWPCATCDSWPCVTRSGRELLHNSWPYAMRRGRELMHNPWPCADEKRKRTLHLLDPIHGCNCGRRLASYVAW
ncbi:hypothetical protein Taro_004201 [Colocasia esculenta]|uniref:Uncharacterized protein n=1 Tax=Colocasia esculenta TaxID=4460 RepID=A0A843TLS1_COLES|nr:hypothetical protein [Colocasia esculenta]